VTADAMRAQRRGPFEAFDWPSGMRELPFRAQIDVRLDPSDETSLRAVERAIGCELPMVPNTVKGDPDARYALWLGPDEWLVVGPAADLTDLRPRPAEIIGVAFVTVVDVSASRTTIELWGEGARDILESGCPLDLHPRAFPTGSCAQTLLARIPIILHQVGDKPRYRIGVRISVAAHLARWLTDAAVGIPGIVP
jgi:sarcosine oxidase subunit gamma